MNETQKNKYDRLKDNFIFKTKLLNYFHNNNRVATGIFVSKV